MDARAAATSSDGLTDKWAGGWRGGQSAHLGPLLCWKFLLELLVKGLIRLDGVCQFVLVHKHPCILLCTTAGAAFGPVQTDVHSPG